MIKHQTTAGAAKKRLSSRDLALVASFAALIAVLGLPGAVVLPGNLVPITLQSMGIMLAGSILGWVRGAAAIGWLVQRRLPAYPLWWGGLANVLGGIGVVYLVGIPVQAAVTGTSVWVAAVSSLAFLPGDGLKVVIATAVASAVHRGYPGITAGTGATASEERGERVSAR